VVHQPDLTGPGEGNIGGAAAFPPSCPLPQGVRATTCFRVHPGARRRTYKLSYMADSVEPQSANVEPMLLTRRIG
jgi:hypothetical protein